MQLRNLVHKPNSAKFDTCINPPNRSRGRECCTANRVHGRQLSRDKKARGNQWKRRPATHNFAWTPSYLARSAVVEWVKCFIGWRHRTVRPRMFYYKFLSMNSLGYFKTGVFFFRTDIFALTRFVPALSSVRSSSRCKYRLGSVRSL